MAELDALIGLPLVKEEIHALTRFLKVQQLRQSQGLPVASQSLHFVFSGNPGTGKTTVARIVSRILCGLGLLQTNKLVECDQSHLVAGYVGHTAIKTNELIDSAIDGVLFIDEAYALLPKGDQNSFGKEAIDTLLKRMEDDRGRLVVVVAGYTEPMQRFLESNLGLRSRFTRFIHFEDYRPPDLCRIFDKFCLDQQYEMSPQARASLGLLFTLAYNLRDGQFGNGRFVRNIFETAITRHSSRVGDMVDLGSARSVLTTLESSDIPLDALKVPSQHPARVDLSVAKWRCQCPACDKIGLGSEGQLGQLVACGCGESFHFPWWGLMAETVKGVPLDLLSTSETWDIRGLVAASVARENELPPDDFVTVSEGSSASKASAAEEACSAEGHSSAELFTSESLSTQSDRSTGGRDADQHRPRVDKVSESTPKREDESADASQPVHVPCPRCGEPALVRPSDWFKKVRCNNSDCRVIYFRPSPIPGTSKVLKVR